MKADRRDLVSEYFQMNGRSYMNNLSGQKFDKDKERWSLLPIEPVKEIVKVLTLGAIKYDDNNWKEVENPKDRYYSAMQRHITSWWDGENYDKETKLHPLAHAGCCLIFLLWFELTKEKK